MNTVVRISKKPRKLPKAERVKRVLHQRVQHERSQAGAVAREAHLRSLLGLPARPPLPDHDQQAIARDGGPRP